MICYKLLYNKFLTYIYTYIYFVIFSINFTFNLFQFHIEYSIRTRRAIKSYEYGPPVYLKFYAFNSDIRVFKSRRLPWLIFVHFALLLSAFRLLLLPVFRQFSLHFCARFDYFIAIFCAHLHPPPPPPYPSHPHGNKLHFEIKTFRANGKNRKRKSGHGNRILDFVFQLAHQLANKTL